MYALALEVLDQLCESSGAIARDGREKQKDFEGLNRNLIWSCFLKQHLSNYVMVLKEIFGCFC